MKLSVFTKTTIIPVVAILILGSCSRDKICDCIDAGDALNKKSSQILEKGEATKADEKKIAELRKTKKSKCAEFETMGGPEMLERKESCK